MILDQKTQKRAQPIRIQMAGQAQRVRLVQRKQQNQMLQKIRRMELKKLRRTVINKAIRLNKVKVNLLQKTQVKKMEVKPERRLAKKVKQTLKTVQPKKLRKRKQSQMRNHQAIERRIRKPSLKTLMLNQLFKKRRHLEAKWFVIITEMADHHTVI